MLKDIFDIPIYKYFLSKNLIVGHKMRRVLFFVKNVKRYRSYTDIHSNIFNPFIVSINQKLKKENYGKEPF